MLVRNRCQRNILQIFEEIVRFSSFNCLLTLNFYKMQFQVLYFTFICYQLILIIEFVPKMKYLCFDLMFLSKINQVMLAILLFLDLRSVLQMIFFVTFYFLLFLFDQTILVLDGCYFQTSKIITTSIGIIWHCVHFERNCYIFIFYLP